MLRRIAPIITIAALAASGLTMVGLTAPAVGSTTDGKVTATRFALESSGYASRVKGGDVPAGSDRSAFQVIACTNKAGLNKTNSEAAVDLGGGISLDTTRTRTWTTEKGGAVSSWSRHSIARANLAETPLGTLYLAGVVATAHAWHDASGFHSKTTASVARIGYDAPVGDDILLDIPAPGQTITIPLVATITLGEGAEQSSGHSALAMLDAIKVKLLPTGTVVNLAHSRATIQDGVTTDLYGGSAYASKVDVLEGTLSSGRTPALVVPCVGTNGVWKKKAIAHAVLTTDVGANVLKSRERAGETANGRPEVTTASHVASVDLGGGLIVHAVSGTAHVARTASGYQRDAHGTIGRITLNGDVLQFPDSGVIEIPDLARLEQNIIHKSARGAIVTALRITLLDGRLAVINLGYAKATLAPSGLH